MTEAEAAQLQFTVLYGSFGLNAAHCYLLEVSGVKILLDCGWDSSFDTSILEPLEKVADKIALVLISHSNLEHLGALPYAYRKFKLTAPCYLTSPVIKLGQLALYDSVLNGSAPYTLDDIDAAILTWRELKYRQPGKIDLGNGESMVITPHSSGRTLGGAVWSIVQESILSILYVSDAYQKRERFLDGIDLGRSTSLLKEPTLLIQDAVSLSKVAPFAERVDQRDAELVRTVLECLRKGGDILIPVDSCSRVIEILLVLDEEWTRSSLQKSYELVFLTRVSSLIDMANSHLEWTSRGLQELSDAVKTGGKSPLSFSNVAIVDSFEDAFATSNMAARVRPPRVIVCGGVDMESNSFSREVFIREICHRASCVVLLVCESLVKNSLARQLLLARNQQSKVVSLMEERWVDLEGEELAEYLRKQKILEEERQRERETEVDLIDFEKNVNENDRNENADDLAVNDFIRVATTPDELKRSSTMASERGIVASGPGMDPVGLKRTSTYLAAMNEREEMLSYSFVPPSDSDAVWDQYGIQYNAADYLGEEEAKRAGLGTGNADAATIAQSGAKTANKTGGKSLEILGNDAEDMGAKKKIWTKTERTVKCQVKVVDFDGRMSARDLFEFVNFIKPRKLVVVRATAEDAEQFAMDCQTKPACGVGLAPAPNECLDIAADSSVVRVRIAEDTLQTSQSLVSIAGLSVQRLRGKLALDSLAGTTSDEANAATKKRRVVTAGGELPTIVPLKEGDSAMVDRADNYLISKKQEPNWATIMERLTRLKIQAKLQTFDDKLVLLCNEDEVVIWKPSEGQFIVGGALCDTYFTVRRALYDCFASV